MVYQIESQRALKERLYAAKAGDTFQLVSDIEIGDTWESIDAVGITIQGRNHRIGSAQQPLNAPLIKYALDCSFNDIILTIDIPDPSGMWTGALVRTGEGVLIENCTAHGTVRAQEGAGGLAGRLLRNSRVERCANYADVGGKQQYFGGIVGFTNFTGISQCTNHGRVAPAGNSRKPMYFGGIAGRFCNSDLVYCKNKGEISGGDGQVIGGIAGYVSGDIQITGNSNHAKVSGGHYVGGIVGDSFCLDDETVRISDNRNEAPVRAARTCAGGIVGSAFHSVDVTRNYTTERAAVTSGKQCAGGIVGFARAHGASSKVDISNNLAMNGSVKSSDFGHPILGCFAQADGASFSAVDNSVGQTIAPSAGGNADDGAAEILAPIRSIRINDASHNLNVQDSAAAADK